VVIGALVFSHWVLDFIVHREDLALLPGNAGDLRVGLSLWKVEWAAIALEALILIIGAALYWRAGRTAEGHSQEASTSGGLSAATLTTAVIVLSGLVVLTLDVALA
jgi:hypothetical protein